MNYKEQVIDVIDYPKPGIVFKDLTPLWSNPKTFSNLINDMTAPWTDKNVNVVASIESRGFIVGEPVAEKLGAGFLPLRKPNKLPRDTFSESFDLEYGSTSIHVHKDAIGSHSNVLVIDDLLATGGTAIAAYNLMQRFPYTNIVGFGFIAELNFLKGREKLINSCNNPTIDSIIQYAN